MNSGPEGNSERPRVAGYIKILSPLEPGVIERLKAGERVLISGVVYTARDAAHRRFIEAMDRGEKLPFDITGQTIYYMGPSPPRPGQIIGSSGPTTSSRMDPYTPGLLATGLKGMIGKGSRSPEVKEAIRKYGAVYFVTIGGAAALLARSVKEADAIAYHELGAEAVFRLVVEDLPAIVAYDVHGGDVFEEGRQKYRRR